MSARAVAWVIALSKRDEDGHPRLSATQTLTLLYLATLADDAHHCVLGQSLRQVAEDIGTDRHTARLAVLALERHDLLRLRRHDRANGNVPHDYYFPLGPTTRPWRWWDAASGGA